MSHVKFLFCGSWGAMNRKQHDNYSKKKEVSEMLVQRTQRKLLPADVSEDFRDEVILVLVIEYLVGPGLSEVKGKYLYQLKHFHL